MVVVCAAVFLRDVVLVAGMCDWVNLLTGAEEACWAHNPKVLGSKPRSAKIKVFRGCSSVAERLFRIQKVGGSIPLISNGPIVTTAHAPVHVLCVCAFWLNMMCLCKAYLA